MVELNNKTDNLEQYSRRSNLRIYGVMESNRENTDNLVVNIAQEKLGVSLSPDDIDRSHRIGKPRRGKPRAIIVKFSSYKKRMEIFKNKSKLKGSSLTIREDLTSLRMKTLSAAVEAFELKNVWSSDGNIVIKSADGSKTTVKTPEELTELINSTGL